MSQRSPWTDQKTEDIIGTLLRAGVTLAAAVVLAGGLLYLARHGREPANYRVFQGEPTDLRHVASIVRDAFALHSRGIIQLGLLLLIATPIARVAFAVFAFAAERDKLYVVFTLIVLGILMYSLMGSS
jgi:uncharacterized membrane protein